MLSEPKKRQKITADPQNRKWADDKTGFGFKMLQKMGWEEGMGLGPSHGGQVENIRIKAKADTVGIGVCEQSYQQLDSFERLLQSMSSIQSPPAGKKKRKTVKADKVDRLAHRRRFIKDKKVETYSERHLNEILGLRHN